MVVPTTSLAQARDIDILIFKLQELRSDESELEQDVKTASEKVKKLKASLEEVRAKKNKIIDELSGKKTYPLFDEIKKLETELEAEQDRLETDPIAASGEAPAQEVTNSVTEIKLERVGENKEKVKLVRGDQSVEINLEEIELHFVGNGPDEYATYDALCDSGWAELQNLETEELINLWQEYYKEPEVSNVVNFFSNEAASEATETTPNLQPDQPIEVDNSEHEQWHEQWPEQWPEQIHALRKPDGSIILKLANKTRKIDAGVVTPGDVDFDNQEDLNKLWLSDKAYDYNPGQDKTEISSLSGKKPTRKRKPAEVTV